MMNPSEHQLKLSIASFLYGDLRGAAIQIAGSRLPADPSVIRELRKILRDDPFFKEQNLFFSLNSKWLNSFLNTLVTILHYPLLIVIGIGAIIGLYFLIRKVAPYLQGKTMNGQPAYHSSSPNKDLPPNHFLSLYRGALDQARAQLYKPALVLLHKATVEYLLTKIIIAVPGKKYTNNDLKRKLTPSQPLYRPFCIISNYAEIAGFSKLEVTQADFTHALEVFEKSFL